MDKGFGPLLNGDPKSEFVLVTGWRSVEQYHDFAKTEGFQKYGQIINHLIGADIKHAVQIDLRDEAQAYSDD